jgi:hypothetical protein
MRFASGLMALLTAAAVMQMNACGDASGPKVGPPATVLRVSGDGQTAEVGTKLANPLVINVADAQGRNVAGVTIAWSVASGTLSASSSLTDADGIATISWTLGSVAGTQQATATATGLTPVTFTQTAVAGPVAQIILTRDTVRLLGIGDAFRLNARAADGFGNPVALGTTVESGDTSIVTADNFGSGAILTAHASARTTTVRATAGTITKTATVIVLPPPCQAGASASSLEVGQIAVFSASDASEFCVQGTSAGAEFIAIPFFSDFHGTLLRLSISTGNTVIGATANRLAAAGFQLQQAVGPTRLRKDDAFETALRERALIELTPLIPAARAARAARTGNAGRFNLSVAVPQVGDVMKFNTNSSSACSNANIRTGRVVSISNRAIVVADTANPANGFTTPDYDFFGAAFDTLVYPVDTLNFGTPSDEDNNQRVVLFFTRAVNELTPPGQNFYVGGFFFGRDLFPTTGVGNVQGCAGSNFAEMFYLLVPDPDGIVNQNVRTTDFVKGVTVSTLAHEFQHLINASRHLYVNGSSIFEDVFLDEGLAHMAEELTFFRASGLSPRQNITYQAIQASQKTQDAFDNFASANFRRLREYLTNPLTNSPYANNANLTTRGAIWSFLRYAADRRAGAEGEMWFQLANPPPGIHGISNITRVVTPDLADWVRDWSIANYADDFIPGIPTIDADASWDVRSMVSAVNQGKWPLDTQQLETTTITSLGIGDGSAAYLRFGVAPNAVGGGRITARGAPVPTGFVLSILRTK